MDTSNLNRMAHEGIQTMRRQPRNVGDNERWASIVGGSLATMMGLRRGGMSGMMLGMVGGMLLYRGTTGHCPISQQIGRNTASDADKGLMRGGEVHVHTAITVDRPPEELYSYWRNFENLPRFMQHYKDITNFSDRRSHWVAQAPLGQTLEWDSEVTEDVPNERIAWRAVEGSDVEHHGEVRFRPAAGGRGTEIQVDMSYRPPLGALGTMLAKFFQGVTARSMHEDIRRFKQLMEAGEIPTAERAPGGQQPSSGPTTH